jgi:heme oxygenase
MAHDATEALLGSLQDRLSYGFYLRGLHAFRTAEEAAFRDIHWPSEFGAWRPACIAPHLAQDLADLGLEPIYAPIEENAPVLKSLLGVCYVLEGSALGARVLRKRAEALGFSETFGARHLAHQSASLENWRRFLELLGRLPSEEIAEIEEAAISTFERAGSCFERAAAGA